LRSIDTSEGNANRLSSLKSGSNSALDDLRRRGRITIPNIDGIVDKIKKAELPRVLTARLLAAGDHLLYVPAAHKASDFAGLLWPTER